MKTQSFRKAVVLAAGVAGLLTLGTERADATLIVSAPTFLAAQGTTGTFDIILQNTGSAVSIGGASFGITTANAGITFTLADISTSTGYIFAANSFFGPDITITSGTSLTASDSANIPTSVSVGTTTVGLGRVTYVIDSNAATGPFAITLSPTATSLADGLGSNIAIDSLLDGSITVSTATPEPAQLGLASGLFILAGAWLRRKR